MIALSSSNLAQLLKVLAAEEQFVFLDTVQPGRDNSRSLLFRHPLARLRCHRDDDRRVFLAQIEEALAAGHYVAGWFGYEFGYLLEENLRPLLCRPGDESLLLAELGVFAEPCFFDHTTGATNFPGVQQVEGSAAPGDDDYPAGGEAFCGIANVRPSRERDEYVRALRAIQQYIASGDTYQVNYTLKLFFDFLGSPEALYVRLRRNQSAAYGAYLRCGDLRLLSFSPELFFRKGQGEIVVRPMKGTMKRGRFPEEDTQLGHRLRTDAKNRSENVMIVDLLRNDLGRLMHDLDDSPVRVRSLFDVEQYETLWQMTSTIVAEAGEARLTSLSLEQLFRALFPCGSVTGAPKVRTMEIINELEPLRRGPYTGAIGYLAPSGAAVFSVPIRTVALRGGQGEMGIGSGIVAESDAEQEWQECLLKARFLTSPAPAFDLIETLLWEPGAGYWLLEEHLERLRTSAQYFLFRCDPSALTQTLQKVSDSFAASSPMRVRLLLAKDGRVAITAQPCPLPATRVLPAVPATGTDLPQVALAAVATDSTAPWYFHKTTWREVYDAGLRQARENGLLDCIFVNERSELTEGSIANIILYRQGNYVTPSLHCGLLAGIMRKTLLADRRIPVREEVLTLEDVRQADAVFLCNSVRGVVQVRVRI